MDLNTSVLVNENSKTANDIKHIITSNGSSKNPNLKITYIALFVLVTQLLLGLYLHHYIGREHQEIRDNFLTLFKSNAFKEETLAEIWKKMRTKNILSRTRRHTYNVYVGENCETKCGFPAINPEEISPEDANVPVRTDTSAAIKVFGGKSKTIQADELGLPVRLVPESAIRTPQGPPELTRILSELFKADQSGPGVYGNEPERLGLGVNNVFSPGPVGLQTERPTSAPPAIQARVTTKGLPGRPNSLSKSCSSFNFSFSCTNCGSPPSGAKGKRSIKGLHEPDVPDLYQV